MDKQTYKQRTKKVPVQVSLADFNRYIKPHLSRAWRGPKGKLSSYQIFNYILFVLYTGIQWNRLPIPGKQIHYSNIHKWHVKWSRDGSYDNLMKGTIKQLLLDHNLDLSIIHGDGSKSRSAGERSALRHNVFGGKEAECRNTERKQNFAKCWGFGGKYFAKFASRALGFLGGIKFGLDLNFI
jgi:transposase